MAPQAFAYRYEPGDRQSSNVQDRRIPNVFTGTGVIDLSDAPPSMTGVMTDACLTPDYWTIKPGTKFSASKTNFGKVYTDSEERELGYDGGKEKDPIDYGGFKYETVRNKFGDLMVKFVNPPLAKRLHKPQNTVFYTEFPNPKTATSMEGCKPFQSVTPPANSPLPLPPSSLANGQK